MTELSLPKFLVETVLTALAELFRLFKLLVSLFFFETHWQLSLSYFACQNYSLPIVGWSYFDGSHILTLPVWIAVSLLLVKVVLTALAELLCRSEFRVSLFWLKPANGPYRATLPISYTTSLVWLKLFWRLSLNYFVCRNSPSPCVWLKLSNGPYRVTLLERITISLIVAWNCYYGSRWVILLVWNHSLPSLVETHWRLSLSYFASPNSKSPYFLLKLSY